MTIQNPIDSVRSRIEKAYADSKTTGEYTSELVDLMYQEFLTVLEEIEVYEEELTVQNSELESQRFEIEKQRRRYEDLFNFAPEAYLVTDLHGVIREGNQMAARLLNISQDHLIGKPLVMFIEENNRKRFRLLLSSLQEIFDFDIRVQPFKAQPIEVGVRMASIKDKFGKPFEIRWVLRDITESKKMQTAIRKSEERLMRVFTSSPTLIILMDEHGAILESNKALLDQLHYRITEVVHQPVEQLIFPEDWPVFQEQLENLAQRPEENIRFEVRFLDWNHNVRWMRVSLSRLNPVAGEESSILMMTDDFTAERQIESERLEIRQRVMEGIENERVRLAQDLHDHPLQDLYGALFVLMEVAEDQSTSENRNKLERVQSSMQQTIDSLRATCGELRPPSLRFYGLEKAIRYYIELIKPGNPKLKFQLDLEQDNNRLPPPLALALYRIMQQGVINVIRHSQASQASITMHFSDGSLNLKIEDNGVGFVVPDKLMDMVREGHYGLAGITERVESIGGEIQIESKPNAGTSLSISVPADALA